jgi:hypothetical protein
VLHKIYGCLTNGFSKKVENLAHPVSLHYALQLRPAAQDPDEDKQRLPDHPRHGTAMAAEVADHVWTLTEIAAVLD